MARPPSGIRRKHDKWYGRWYGADGRRREKCLGPDLREAKRLLAEYVRNARRSRAGLEDEVGGDARLEVLREEYLAELIVAGRSSSHRRDVSTGLAHVLDALPCTVASRLTPQSILAARRVIAASGASNRTVNKKLGHFRTMLSWLEATGRIPRSPYQGIKPLPEGGKHQRRRRHRLLANEARGIVAAAREIDVATRRRVRIPQAPLIEFILGTGARLGEATSATWGDVLREEASVSVRFRPEASSKNPDGRTNPISEELAATLRDLRLVQGRALERLPGRDDLILVTPTGLPWSEGNLRNARAWLYRVLDRAGMERKLPDGTVIDFHALRHSYCCFLREAGVDVGTAAALMGHRTIAVTQAIYSSLDRLPKRAAIELLPHLAGVVTGGHTGAAGK